MIVMEMAGVKRDITLQYSLNRSPRRAQTSAKLTTYFSGLASSQNTSVSKDNAEALLSSENALWR